MDCVVKYNCLKAYDCDFCVDYGSYCPQDRKILSPRQIEAKELRKAKKKEIKGSAKSKQGKANRVNGQQSERDLKKLLLSWGLEADKTPMSGAFKGGFIKTVNGEDLRVELSGDLWVKVGGNQYRIENKRRGNINRFYNLCEMYEVTYLEDFCYIMTQDVFHSILNGVRFPIDSFLDKGFKTLHGFFDQDQSHIVTLKTPYKPFLFCINKSTWEEITA